MVFDDEIIAEIRRVPFLDTNAVIALFEGNQMFVKRLRTYQPSDFSMPSIVHHELCFGAYKTNG